MSNYVKLTADAGDQYLSQLAETQENFLKAISDFTTRFAAATPAVATPAALAALLPTPQEVTEANFAFAQKLLKQQKGFFEKLLTASAPATK